MKTEIEIEIAEFSIENNRPVVKVHVATREYIDDLHTKVDYSARWLALSKGTTLRLGIGNAKVVKPKIIRIEE